MRLTVPPVIYCAAVNNWLSITSVKEDILCFQYLFEVLAHKGVFLDECDDVIITKAILSTQHPFNVVSVSAYSHASPVCLKYGLTHCQDVMKFAWT